MKHTDILSAIIDACQFQYRTLKEAERTDVCDPTWRKPARDAWSQRRKTRRARIEGLLAAEPILKAAVVAAKTNEKTEIVITLESTGRRRT